MEHFQYLFAGLEGNSSLVPWMWTSVTLAALSLVLLIVPRFRNNDRVLAVTCAIVFLSLWIDKGLGLIVGGFIPSPLGAVTSYAPTLPEISIAAAVWAIGFLMITVFYKITLSVRESLAG
jgi:molybdopterin-containing oxidoreductase family membrane subunit